MARILIVEDDPIFAEVLACMLEVEGHEITVANAAGEGVWLGLANGPDIVVADWCLRDEIHGGEVCRRIHAAWPRVKIVMMTGHEEYASRAAEYCEGVEAVLTKPFHMQEIIEAIRLASTGGEETPPAPPPVSDSRSDLTFDAVLGTTR